MVNLTSLSNSFVLCENITISAVIWMLSYSHALFIVILNENHISMLVICLPQMYIHDKYVSGINQT